MKPKPEPLDFVPTVAPGFAPNTVVLYVYRDSAGAIIPDSLVLIERMKRELNYVAPTSVDSGFD